MLFMNKNAKILLMLGCSMMLAASAPTAVYAKGTQMNTPCSGAKGGIAKCSGAQFVCKDGSVSESKRDCREYLRENKGNFTPNTPCSGTKGGIDHCQGKQFICKDGSTSSSKLNCIRYEDGKYNRKYINRK